VDSLSKKDAAKVHGVLLPLVSKAANDPAPEVREANMEVLVSFALKAGNLGLLEKVPPPPPTHTRTQTHTASHSHPNMLTIIAATDFNRVGCHRAGSTCTGGPAAPGLVDVHLLKQKLSLHHHFAIDYLSSASGRQQCAY